MNISEKNFKNQEDLISTKISTIILNGYINHISAFKVITRNAKTRFENRDWHGIQSDMKDRLNLYKNDVVEITNKINIELQDYTYNSDIWLSIKEIYRERIESLKDSELAQTFFNSVCRKVFVNKGVDASIMFVLLEQSKEEMNADETVYRTYSGKLTPEEITRNILNDYSFNVPYEDMERDISYIVREVRENILTRYKADRNTKVEVLKPVFFRNKSAYIVGRTFISGQNIPFLLPIHNKINGIYVDTVIFDPDLVSIVFSFARSYFMVDIEYPYDVVNFLRSLMPFKRFPEIYNSIGFSKHGKTVFYRSFLNHLSISDDKFITAPGIKGMVMAVFTLPSYNVVFKIIRDYFEPPKKMTREQVKEKYRLVKQHDRVGRMADTHEFEYFTFSKDRFSDELLKELRSIAANSLIENEDTIIIKHLYTERKMIPLNIALEQASIDEAEELVSEYGNAIKQLAAANIFPGDMLLKNFGVTRHNRVVFYDYDEIGFLTDFNFRSLPVARDDFEEYAADSWFAVEENDIFPEEFKKFLIGREDIREIFFRLHNDIFSPKFWNEIKKRLLAGEIVDVFPYRKKMRFKEKYG